MVLSPTEGKMYMCANCGQLFEEEYLYDVDGNIEKQNGQDLKITVSWCLVCCTDKGLIDFGGQQ